MKVAPEVRDAKRTIRPKPKKENSKSIVLAPGPHNTPKLSLPPLAPEGQGLKPLPDHHTQPAYPCPPRDTNISWKGNCRCRSRSITSSHLESPGDISSSWKQGQGDILGVWMARMIQLSQVLESPAPGARPPNPIMDWAFRRTGQEAQMKKPGRGKEARVGKDPGNPEG